MPSSKFHIVDVFATSKYAGNQLAVFHETAGLTTDEMQQLTDEMNYSESTFIDSAQQRDGGYDVRIFDLVEELPFAGHPTLGTAYVIREFVHEDSPDELELNLDIGRIPVTVERNDDGEEMFWMQQVAPSFGETFDHEFAARVLSLKKSDVDENYPVQLVSTGILTLIVPLRSLDAVQRAATNLEPYYENLVEPYGNLNVLLFASETYEGHDLNVRVFAEGGGVPEDPATGSSNGCLAAYLVKYEYFGASEVDVQVEQGYEIHRPSLLHLRANQKKDEIEVSVGGQVFPVAEGRLL